MDSNDAYFLVNGQQVFYTDGKSDREIEEEVQKSVDSMIVKSSVTWTWDNLGALEGVKSVMDEVIDSLSEPQIPGNIGDEAILLFGANGVGKTSIALAIANATNATFFVPIDCHLLSWVQGRTTKIMEGLFKRARQESCAVILFDFLDMMFYCEDEMFYAFLDQMKCGSKIVSKKIIVIGCTDMPERLSQNVLRWFKHSFYIPKPNRYACGKILETQLKSSWHSFDNKDYKDFATLMFSRSSVISGWDISRVVLKALTHQYREPKKAEDFCRVTDKFINVPDQAIGKLIPWKVEYGEECRIGKTYKEICADKELKSDLVTGPLGKNVVVNIIQELGRGGGHDENTYVEFMRIHGGLKLEYDNEIVEIEEEKSEEKKKKSIWSKLFGF